MKAKNIFCALSAALTLFTTISCVDVNELFSARRTIAFKANSSYQNSILTRTVYSGVDETDSNLGNTSAFERIDWVEDDRIRILCEQASLISGNEHWADYLIDPGSGQGKEGFGGLKPADGNGLQWGGENTDHYIYAFYPSPSISNSGQSTGGTVPAATIETYGTNQARISGTIPAAQDSKLKDNVFWPNMNYAYMYACAKSSSGNTVSLAFSPLFTAFEFSILTPAGMNITSRLVSLSLVSSQEDSYLAGDFKAVLGAGGLESSPVIEDGTGSNTLTVTLPQPVALSSSQAVRITLLALPRAQSKLTVTLTFEDGTTRSLELKYNDQWITVGACSKAYFKLAAPSKIWEYSLDASIDKDYRVVKAGEARVFTVASSRSRNGVTETIPYTVEYSLDGSNWSSTADWATKTDVTGGFQLAISEETTPRTWKGDKTNEVGSPASPRDLSCYDIYGQYAGGTEGSAPYNTANCYVVSAPGWYRIPCVYGNAIKDGGANTSAYTGYTGTRLTTYVNHEGNEITKPWISKPEDEQGMGVNITSAGLVWSDVAGVVSDISYADNYITFHIEGSTLDEGNVLISAKNSAGIIVWSWHIWLVDKPMSFLKQLPWENYAGTKMTILSRPLGYTVGSVDERTLYVKITQDKSGGKTEIFKLDQHGSDDFHAMFYQWGRKDPFDPLTIFTKETGPAYIENTIQNPNLFFKNGGDWNQTPAENLWNSAVSAGATSNTLPELDIVKTVYDPCPSGFNVMPGNAFTGLTTTGQRESTKLNVDGPFFAKYGYCVYTDKNKNKILWLPALGTLSANNGDWIHKSGDKAQYWTGATVKGRQSGKPDLVEARYVWVETENINPNSGNFQALATPIFAIAEK